MRIQHVDRLAFIVLLLATAPGTSSAARSEATRIRRVEEGLLPPVLIHGEKRPGMRLQSRMQRWKVPGIAVAVIDGGKVAWTRAYGVAEAGSADPVTDETLFQAGSVSKPIAAMTALNLVESGAVKLDGDVNRSLSSWRIPPADSLDGAAITLRMLLSHSAGLTVHGFPGYAVGDSLPSLVQVLDGVAPANTPPIRVGNLPGKSFSYSGGGFCVVQQLLIDATRQPYAELAGKAVLGPVGMVHSTYEQPTDAVAGVSRAAGHDRDGLMIAGRWHRYPELAAAGLWTTAADLARLVLEVQSSWKGSSHRVLSSEMTRIMLSPQVTANQGLGWRLDGKGRSARFEHSGDTDGFACAVVGYLERGQGAVVMTNGTRGGNLVQEVMRGIAKEYGWPDYRPEERKVVVLSEATLRHHVGRYALDIAPNVLIDVSVSGDSLTVAVTQPSGTERGSLLAESPDRFFEQDTGLEVTFSPPGTTPSLVIRQGDEEYRATLLR